MRVQEALTLKNFIGLFNYFIPMGILVAVGAWLPLFWFLTGQWLLLLAYISWYVWDRNSPERGGYPSDMIRRQKSIHQWYADYFPVRLHKTADLSPENNYLIVYHPHGIAAHGTHAHFATYCTGWKEKFPGIEVSICGLHLNFYFPFRRELLMLYGYISCSKDSIEHALTKQGKGRAAVLVVGGAEESLEAHPGRSTLTLARRQGFVKEALKTGAHLVPVYSFGENDVYIQAENPPGSILRSIQTFAKKSLGFTFPMCYGRGFFKNSWGPFPLSTPIDTVIGAPIPVEKTLNPSKEVVNKLHSKYILELTALFEKHKTKFGIPKDQQLTLK